VSDAAFEFQVIMPDGALPPVLCTFLEVPAADGRLTVLAGHQPLICALDTGVCRVRDAHGAQTVWHCSDGALEVNSGGHVALLVREWKLQDDTMVGMREA
jgi:F0F1-type ATP synthase epsilon subunit